MKVGDRVKQKKTMAQREGTIVEILENDLVFEHEGQQIVYAVKGECMVKFDLDKGDGRVPFPPAELELI